MANIMMKATSNPAKAKYRYDYTFGYTTPKKRNGIHEYRIPYSLRGSNYVVELKLLVKKHMEWDLPIPFTGH